MELVNTAKTQNIITKLYQLTGNDYRIRKEDGYYYLYRTSLNGIQCTGTYGNLIQKSKTLKDFEDLIKYYEQGESY